MLQMFTCTKYQVDFRKKHVVKYESIQIGLLC